MNKLIITITAILIFTTSSLFANNTDDLVKKMQQIQSMSADFTQKLVDGQNNGQLNSVGTMELKKPKFFKWTTSKPNNQEIVSNGSKLWIYDGDLEQLIVKKVSNNISQFPYLILLSKNTNNINKLFNVTKKNDNTYILTPKDDQMINNIKIKFAPNGQLKGLGISTSLHQYTQITFSNVKTNIKTIKNSNFNFKAPKGTDTIDETTS